MEKWRINAKSFISGYGKVFILVLLLFILAITLTRIFSILSPSTLTVSFLDIGQGDAIVVTTPSGKQMLIDGGPSNKIIEKLSEEINFFDTSVDVVVATHADSDHVTGLIPVLKKYEVSKVVVSNVKGTTGIFGDLTSKIENETKDIHVAHKGDMIDFGDGVVAHILYPDTHIAQDTNDGSVSMVVIYGEESFLLTGDLSSKLEPELLVGQLPKHVTVYKAGHHGSKTSSGQVLLSYIHPEYAVISAGTNNDYGHPHAETLERLSKYGKEIISTIDHGTITFRTDGKILKVFTEK